MITKIGSIHWRDPEIGRRSIRKRMCANVDYERWICGAWQFAEQVQRYNRRWASVERPLALHLGSQSKSAPKAPLVRTKLRIFLTRMWGKYSPICSARS
jgi:hypothetical protein